jgi:DNA-binding NarL/FixJ family response regulator
MARILALIPDLLFGSRVQADMLAGGHEIELMAKTDQLQDKLAGVDVLIVDLTDENANGVQLIEALGESRPRTLGFYSHVDVAARERAEQGGLDMVVPRSRMARESAQLVAKLLN